MIWLILALFLVFGFPFALAAFGLIASAWLVMAVAGLIWGVLSFFFGMPLLAALIGLGVGVWIGRGGLDRLRGP
jgi:hypothetical protein